MRSTIFAVISGLAAFAQATTPTTQCTDGCNPVYTPALNQIVPVGSSFNITWGPTTKGTLSIILLRGPSTNVVPLSTIVEGTPNTGSFLWTPATTLEADTTHYGIQLIDDATGQFQYSNQFGISNSAAPVSSGVSSGTASRASASSTSTGGSSITNPAVVTSSATPAASSAKGNSSAAISSILSSKIASASSVLSSATASKSSSASGSKTSSSAIVTASGSFANAKKVSGVLGLAGAAVAVFAL